MARPGLRLVSSADMPYKPFSAASFQCGEGLQYTIGRKPSLPRILPLSPKELSPSGSRMLARLFHLIETFASAFTLRFKLSYQPESS